MLNEKDKELIEAARVAIARRYRDEWQEVGAALRTRDGRIITGVNIDAYLGRMAVCAEAIAIGRSITETGDAGIDTIVAVRHPEPTEADQTIRIVSPCGSCREIIYDYDPQARVIVPDGNGATVMSIGILLPNKYVRGPGRW
jgi:cytidine deaminase